MTHQIRVCASVGTDRLGVWCSCTPKKLILHGEPGGVYSLDGLNKIAHEHIEAAEAAEINERDMRLNGHLHKDLPEGYRVESAVTSEDDMIDMAAEGRSGAIGLG